MSHAFLAVSFKEAHHIPLSTSLTSQKSNCNFSRIWKMASDRQENRDQGMQKLFDTILKSNAGPALAIQCYEKLLETEFVCSCKTNNFLTCSFFVLCSTTIFIVFACAIIGCSMKEKTCVSIMALLLPLLTWTVTITYEGNYYACLKSDWEGDWTTNLDSRKWCQPTATNQTTNSTNLKRQSMNWFHQSKVCLCIAYNIDIIWLIHWFHDLHNDKHFTVNWSIYSVCIFELEVQVQSFHKFVLSPISPVLK